MHFIYIMQKFIGLGSVFDVCFVNYGPYSSWSITRSSTE